MRNAWDVQYVTIEDRKNALSVQTWRKNNQRLVIAETLEDAVALVLRHSPEAIIHQVIKRSNLEVLFDGVES